MFFFLQNIPKITHSHLITLSDEIASSALMSKLFMVRRYGQFENLSIPPRILFLRALKHNFEKYVNPLWCLKSHLKKKLYFLMLYEESFIDFSYLLNQHYSLFHVGVKIKKAFTCIKDALPNMNVLNYLLISCTFPFAEILVTKLLPHNKHKRA